MSEERSGSGEAEGPTTRGVRPHAARREAAAGGRGRDGEPADRRACPRFTALDPRGWIGWWSEGEFHEAEARLLDVGEFGAAAEVDRLPPRDCPLFFSLGGPAPVDTVEAEVVTTQPGRLKKILARMAFSSRCPGGLFAAIVHGPTTAAPPDAPAPHGSDMA